MPCVFKIVQVVCIVDVSIEVALIGSNGELRSVSHGCSIGFCQVYDKLSSMDMVRLFVDHVDTL